MTGVQTCALPIWEGMSLALQWLSYQSGKERLSESKTVDYGMRSISVSLRKGRYDDDMVPCVRLDDSGRIREV